MSILQDLDPQYAKIHQQPSATRKPAIWAASLLLAAGGGYWLMTNAPAGAPSPEATPVQATPMQEKTSESPATRSAPPRVASTSSATIMETAKQEVDQRETIPPNASVPANTAESLADGEFRRQTPATPSQAHSTPKHTSGKAERHKTAAPAFAKNERGEALVAKRASERDVDIITAIVR